MTNSTVFVVDDDLYVRESFAALATSMELLSETFSSGEEFLDSDYRERADCVILDSAMPGISGIQVMEKLVVDNVRIPVIFVTGNPNFETCVQAMKWGAVDFLLKPCRPTQLMQSIESAIRMNAQLRREEQHKRSIQRRISALTAREREVLFLAARGKLSKQIARDLGISTKTVDVHRCNITSKMGVESWAELSLLLAPFLRPPVEVTG